MSWNIFMDTSISFANTTIIYSRSNQTSKFKNKFNISDQLRYQAAFYWFYIVFEMCVFMSCSNRNYILKGTFELNSTFIIFTFSNGFQVPLKYSSIFLSIFKKNEQTFYLMHGANLDKLKTLTSLTFANEYQFV